MTDGINVLSLFDGMSCGRLALDRLGIKVNKYYASEIDKWASAVTAYNWDDTIHLGDVTKWQDWNLEDIDLIIGGSPCQGFSFAGDQLAFDDPRSKLFFVFVDILHHYQPKHFLLENVPMKKQYLDVITSYLGVHPIRINSALVSAQNRVRYYWTNLPVMMLPVDQGIMLRDILLEDATEPALSNVYGGYGETEPRVHMDKAPTIRPSTGGGHVASVVIRDKADLLLSRNELEYMSRPDHKGRDHWSRGYQSDSRNSKSACVTANWYKGVPYNVLVDNGCIRKFHPIECERLQTVDDNYTKYGIINGKEREISKTQRYKMLGNGWTVDVISWILDHIYDYIEGRFI